MISIKRPKKPDFLTDDGNIWQKETDKAIKHYEIDKKTKSFEFAKYRDARLKNELKKVFAKCAYCESSYSAVGDGDVEHFRPKGKVTEKDPQTPGYYWLANDWDNLLLSCQHCNQSRKHVMIGETELQSYGKLNQFPLSDETKRISKYDLTLARNKREKLLEEEEKVRIILNPCKDKPERYFEYDINEAVIIPTSKQAEVSVKVYALQRVYLVKERKKQLILLFRQMDRVKREMGRLNNDHSDEQKEEFKKELNDLLNNFTKNESIYAGMCRYFVKKFLKENGIT